MEGVVVHFPSRPENKIWLRPMLVYGVVCSVMLVGILILDGADDIGPFTFLAFVGVGLGALRGLLWKWRLGSTNYRLEGDLLTVTRRGAQVQAWDRSEIDRLRMEDRMTWDALFVQWIFFPRLVIWVGGVKTRCPRVLSWGKRDADEFETVLNAWLSRRAD